MLSIANKENKRKKNKPCLNLISLSKEIPRFSSAYRPGVLHFDKCIDPTVKRLLIANIPMTGGMGSNVGDLAGKNMVTYGVL